MKISRNMAIRLLTGDRMNKPHWIWEWSDEELVDGLRLLFDDKDKEIIII